MELSERTRVQIEQFHMALARFDEILPLNEDDVVRDALIQRFEFTFEIAWRCMFRVLRDWGETTQEVVGKVIEDAFKANLIDNPGVWIEIRDCRNLTSHTYDEKIAIRVAATVRMIAPSAFHAFAKVMLEITK